MPNTRVFIATITAAIPLLWPSLAVAGGAQFGTIMFDTVSAPPVPVPTLGILAAVTLIGGLLAIALHAVRKNQHSLASLAGLGAVLVATLSAGGIGVLQATSVLTQKSVESQDLNEKLHFSCGTITDSHESEFTNATSSSIVVVSIEPPPADPSTPDCIINPTSTCIVSTPPALIQPGDSCIVSARQEQDEETF